MSMRIRRLVDEVDQQHREAMVTIDDDLAELHLGPIDEQVSASRRRFVRNLGLGGAVALGAAVVPVAALVDAAAAQTTDSSAGIEMVDADLQLVTFAQGLELAAAASYTAAVDTKKLSSPQDEMCRTFARHHTDHAAALAKLAGKTNTVTEPNPKLLASLSPQIASASDANAIFTVLYSIEQGAASTYLSSLGTIESFAVSGPVSTILPIEAQHSVAIGEMLGLPLDQWMPPFETTATAFNPSQYAS